MRDGTNAPDGSTGWAPRSGSAIGAGWHAFTHVFAGGDGAIYAVNLDDGALRWYRDLRRDGTNAPDGSTGWAPGSGSQIGSGWMI